MIRPEFFTRDFDGKPVRMMFDGHEIHIEVHDYLEAVGEHEKLALLRGLFGPDKVRYMKQSHFEVEDD